MYYFYKIENLINHNKYIGITTNIIARKNRHFTLLKKNEHFNPHLQNAYNKFGKDNFEFSIIEEKEFDDPKEAYKHEQELINQYDTYNNGYNCNPGGEWTGPKGKFSKKEIFYIKSACYFNERITTIVGDYFGCARGTINNIRIGRNYSPWCQEFDNLSEEEKRQWYEDFCAISNFENIKQPTKKTIRKLTDEQVLIILLCDEFKFTTFTNLRESFDIKGDHRNNFQKIRNGEIYKDIYNQYKKMSQEEKQQKLCIYKEIYK